MEIRSRRNRSDRSGHLYVYDSGALPGPVAVRCGRRGGPRYGPRYATMKRSLGFAALAMLVALALVTQVVTPLVTRVAAHPEPAAPGRGQTLGDTLEASQQARVATPITFTLPHPAYECSH